MSRPLACTSTNFEILKVMTGHKWLGIPPVTPRFRMFSLRKNRISDLKTTWQNLFDSYVLKNAKSEIPKTLTKRYSNWDYIFQFWELKIVVIHQSSGPLFFFFELQKLYTRGPSYSNFGVLRYQNYEFGLGGASLRPNFQRSRDLPVPTLDPPLDIGLWN